MFRKESDKLAGYDYPPPSIERGQSPARSDTPPKPLSREGVEKLAQAIKKIGGNDRGPK